jgi:hypothetical protein
MLDVPVMTEAGAPDFVVKAGQPAQGLQAGQQQFRSAGASLADCSAAKKKLENNTRHTI